MWGWDKKRDIGVMPAGFQLSSSYFHSHTASASRQLNSDETITLAQTLNPKLAEHFKKLSRNQLENIQIVTKETNPNLFRTYADLCEKVGVEDAPTFFLNKREGESWYSRKLNAIQVSEEPKTEDQDWTIAHELVHAKKRGEYKKAFTLMKIITIGIIPFGFCAPSIAAKTTILGLSAAVGTLVWGLAKGYREEYEADRTASRVTGNYDAAIEWFKKYAKEEKRYWNSIAWYHPYTVHARKSWHGLKSIFSPHPSPLKRIRALEEDRKIVLFQKQGRTLDKLNI